MTRIRFKAFALEKITNLDQLAPIYMNGELEQL